MNRNYIAGEWVASDDAVENRNPSDVTDLVCLFAQAGMVQLETAIEAAGGAQQIWQATGLEARQTALMKIGNALIERADGLGKLLSREEGKPCAEGRGEVIAPASSLFITTPKCCARSATIRIRCAPISKLTCAATRSASSR